MLMTLVAFPDEAPWNVDTLARELVAGFGDLADVEQAADGASVLVRAGEIHVRVLPQDKPIPWSLLESPCEDAWYWPEAAEQLRDHARHLIVIVEEERADDSSGGASVGDPVHCCGLLTRVAGRLADAFGALGVYWEPATMVHSAAAFCEAANHMTPNTLPLRAWVNFRVVREEDGTRSLFTTGLTAFGEREIEIWGAKADAKTVVGWAFNTAHYLIAEKPEMKSGEAIAISQSQWVHVFFRPSMFDSEREIYNLVLDE